MDPAGVVVLIIILGAAAIWSAVQGSNQRKRREEAEAERVARVYAKYSSTPYANDILAGVIRQGMTADMVIDAWGDPAAVDRKVYKTKVKEVWKYGPGPRRTFANRVTIEDGIVVGWEQR